MINYALVFNGEISELSAEIKPTYDKHHLHQSPGQGDVLRMMLNKDIEHLAIMAY